MTDGDEQRTLLEFIEKSDPSSKQCFRKLWQTCYRPLGTALRLLLVSWGTGFRGLGFECGHESLLIRLGSLGLGLGDYSFQASCQWLHMNGLGIGIASI